MKTNGIQIQAADQKLQIGIGKHFNDKSIVLANHEFKGSELVDALQREIDALDAARAARLDWLDRVRGAKALERELAPTKRLLRAFIISTFGETSTVLADFGIEPRKPRKKLTTDEKMVIVEKLRATRAARHTMARRQKQSILSQLPADPEQNEPPAVAGPLPTATNGGVKASIAVQ